MKCALCKKEFEMDNLIKCEETGELFCEKCDKEIDEECVKLEQAMKNQVK